MNTSQLNVLKNVGKSTEQNNAPLPEQTWTSPIRQKL